MHNHAKLEALTADCTEQFSNNFPLVTLNFDLTLEHGLNTVKVIIIYVSCAVP